MRNKIEYNIDIFAGVINGTNYLVNAEPGQLKTGIMYLIDKLIERIRELEKEKEPSGD